jgi:prevent-host-death family protein
MDYISVRELRNNGGRVLQRVAGGEPLTVTTDGQPIAELRPLPRRGLTAATVLQRWRHLPRVDAQHRRSDIDRVVDPSPWSVG